jgi:hypothetical protein
MGYYIRLLSPSEIVPDFATLRTSVATKPDISLSVEDGDDSEWSQLLLAHDDDTPIASIERNVVRAGELGAEEIEEFLADIEDCRPTSAVEWLQKYLPTVKNIYAFQILSGTDKGDGWAALYAVRDAINDAAGGIMQADGEGFSNEEGFHILWQFSKSAKGSWQMAVLQDGNWVTFEMELSDRSQREAFLRGEVPGDQGYPARGRTS